MTHLGNWYAGWGMLLAAFVVGAVVGLGFWREDFMGGYTSWPRRLVRLGHIALAALGILNLSYGMANLPVNGSWQCSGAGIGLAVGGISMPLVCFLSAWRKGFRHWFAVPVVSLMGATICVLCG